MQSLKKNILQRILSTFIPTSLGSSSLFNNHNDDTNAKGDFWWWWPEDMHLQLMDGYASIENWKIVPPSDNNNTNLHRSFLWEIIAQQAEIWVDWPRLLRLLKVQEEGTNDDFFSSGEEDRSAVLIKASGLHLTLRLKNFAEITFLVDGDKTNLPLDYLNELELLIDDLTVSIEFEQEKTKIDLGIEWLELAEGIVKSESVKFNDTLQLNNFSVDLKRLHVELGTIKGSIDPQCLSFDLSSFPSAKETHWKIRLDLLDVNTAQFDLCAKKIQSTSSTILIERLERLNIANFLLQRPCENIYIEYQNNTIDVSSSNALHLNLTASTGNADIVSLNRLLNNKSLNVNVNSHTNLYSVHDKYSIHAGNTSLTLQKGRLSGSIQDINVDDLARLNKITFNYNPKIPKLAQEDPFDPIQCFLEGTPFLRPKRDFTSASVLEVRMDKAVIDPKAFMGDGDLKVPFSIHTSAEHLTVSGWAHLENTDLHLWEDCMHIKTHLKHASYQTSTASAESLIIAKRGESIACRLDALNIFVDSSSTLFSNSELKCHLPDLPNCHLQVCQAQVNLKSVVPYCFRVTEIRATQQHLMALEVAVFASSIEKLFLQLPTVSAELMPATNQCILHASNGILDVNQLLYHISNGDQRSYAKGTGRPLATKKSPLEEPTHPVRIKEDLEEGIVNMVSLEDFIQSRHCVLLSGMEDSDAEGSVNIPSQTLCNRNHKMEEPKHAIFNLALKESNLTVRAGDLRLQLCNLDALFTLYADYKWDSMITCHNGHLTHQGVALASRLVRGMPSARCHVSSEMNISLTVCPLKISLQHAHLNDYFEAFPGETAASDQIMWQSISIDPVKLSVDYGGQGWTALKDAPVTLPRIETSKTDLATAISERWCPQVTFFRDGPDPTIAVSRLFGALTPVRALRRISNGLAEVFVMLLLQPSTNNRNTLPDENFEPENFDPTPGDLSLGDWTSGTLRRFHDASKGLAGSAGLELASFGLQVIQLTSIGLQQLGKNSTIFDGKNRLLPLAIKTTSKAKAAMQTLHKRLNRLHNKDSPKDENRRKKSENSWWDEEEAQLMIMNYEAQNRIQ